MDTTAYSFFAASVILNVAFGIIIWKLWKRIERLQKEALTDSLSGLWNRRGGEKTFDMKADAAYRRRQPRRKHRKVWVLVIDIDHFKRVNDVHGHPAGDEAIKTIAKIIRAHFRSTDIHIRLGGEEFAVVMTKSKLEIITEKAEKFRRSVEIDSRLNFNGHQVTVSIGIASTSLEDEFGDNPKLLQAIIGRADIALYRAKHQGRNRIVVWENGDDMPQTS